MGPGPIAYHVNPILQYEFVSSNPETQQTDLQYMFKTWACNVPVDVLVDVPASQIGLHLQLGRQRLRLLC
jgi:hypothetical protein